jgi:Protein of unknown function (DUF1571)
MGAHLHNGNEKIMRARPPGMIPVPEGPAKMLPRLSSLWTLAVLTAACAAGEDRAAHKTEGTPAEPTAAKSKSNAGSDASAKSDQAVESPIERAVRTVAECQRRYHAVSDYTCQFWKRERIAGKLIPAHVMAMKVRTKPQSIYLKFEQPAKGREAIYVAGRHGGKVVAHDVGFNKLLAGTLHLEPTSARAMTDCRHPITEAGIGPLLETVSKRWALELNQNETVVNFGEMLVGDRACLMIETTHPDRGSEFLFHKVRLFIDNELGLPIRFEAYDWPKKPGALPELAEEYTYGELKLNVGLKEIDFDVANSSYSFGRF